MLPAAACRAYLRSRLQASGINSACPHLHVFLCRLTRRNQQADAAHSLPCHMMQRYAKNASRCFKQVHAEVPAFEATSPISYHDRGPSEEQCSMLQLSRAVWHSCTDLGCQWESKMHGPYTRNRWTSAMCQNPGRQASSDASLCNTHVVTCMYVCGGSLQ